MDFTIKDVKTLCDTCFHSHILRPSNGNGHVKICRLLGTPVGPILECNQHMPHVNAPIPAHLFNLAWKIDPKPKSQQVGFGKSVTISPPDPERMDDDDAELIEAKHYVGTL